MMEKDKYRHKGYIDTINELLDSDADIAMSKVPGRGEEESVLSFVKAVVEKNVVIESDSDEEDEDTKATVDEMVSHHKNIYKILSEYDEQRRARVPAAEDVIANLSGKQQATTLVGPVKRPSDKKSGYTSSDDEAEGYSKIKFKKRKSKGKYKKKSKKERKSRKVNRNLG